MGEKQKVATKQVGKEYTDMGVGSLQGAMDFGMGGLQQLINTGRLGALVESQDPQAYWGAFTSQAPQLQGLIQGAQSPLEQSLTDRARRMSQEATNAIGANLSGLGSLYSGATLQQASDATSRAFGDVAAQLGSQQVGLYGNLLGQALGSALSAQEGQYGRRLAEQQALANLFGGIYGQGLGGITSYGKPSFVAYEKNTPWGNFMGGLEDTAKIAALAGTAASGFK